MVRYLTTNGRSNTYGLHNSFALRYRRMNETFYEAVNNALCVKKPSESDVYLENIGIIELKMKLVRN